MGLGLDKGGGGGVGTVGCRGYTPQLGQQGRVTRGRVKRGGGGGNKGVCLYVGGGREGTSAMMQFLLPMQHQQNIEG